jgi:PEP-CTERM motif
MMSERNLLTAILVLLFPLSFGLDLGPGRVEAPRANMNYFTSINLTTPTLHEMILPGLKVRRSVIPDEFALNSIKATQNTGVFESSLLGTTSSDSEGCDSPANPADNAENGPWNEECPSVDGGATSTYGNSGISFPVQDSFKGSDSSEDNRGPGIGGGGGIPVGTGGQTPTDTPVPIPTPEPGSLMLLACGLLAVAALVHKRLQRVPATVIN